MHLVSLVHLNKQKKRIIFLRLYRPAVGVRTKSSKQIVDEIREFMTAYEVVGAPIQAYIIPCTDEHQVNRKFRTVFNEIIDVLKAHLIYSE